MVEKEKGKLKLIKDKQAPYKSLPLIIKLEKIQIKAYKGYNQKKILILVNKNIKYIQVKFSGRRVWILF